MTESLGRSDSADFHWQESESPADSESDISNTSGGSPASGRCSIRHDSESEVVRHHDGKPVRTAWPRPWVDSAACALRLRSQLDRP